MQEQGSVFRRSILGELLDSFLIVYVQERESQGEVGLIVSMSL